MRNLVRDNNASAIPVLLFIATIIALGAMYTLFFIEIGIPYLGGFIPASDTKVFIMMFIYAIPITILIVGVVSLMIAGIKRNTGVGF